jgi:hypothetical protein
MQTPGQHLQDAYLFLKYARYFLREREIWLLLPTLGMPCARQGYALHQ